MDPAAAKQQIAERVKQATKFLVTVNSNPTVDQLAACIGLTLLLNKMGKHATAVFSGKVPSTIEFLQPEKTLETNTDSLRDFIISLDKNKADKLRYKIEDQFVRIYITPYRTSINEKDLIFSEGDFNVEAVIALGIKQRTEIDKAIVAHGRILHDATVISVNAGEGKAPDLGQINWQDPTASSLCEMLVSISEAFGSGLIDNQMATAFLTGIVAETKRFSNARTSPKVMTMSAQLMAAGANQQLIASKLEPPPPEPPAAPPPQPPIPKPPKQPPLKPEGVLDVSHDKDKKQEENEVEVTPTEIHIDEQGNLSTAQALAATRNNAPISPQQPLAPLPTLPPTPPPPTPPPPTPLEPLKPTSHHAYLDTIGQNPTLDVPSGQPDWAAPYDLVPMDPLNMPDSVNEDAPSGRPTSAPSTTQVDNNVNEIGVSNSIPMHAVPPASVVSPVDNARGAVEDALASAPFDPAFAAPIAALNAQPLEPVPVESAPPLQNGDTPSLVLPTSGGSTAPIVNTSAPPPADPLAGVAPPPLPPPLMAAPGAVIPNTPQNANHQI